MNRHAYPWLILLATLVVVTLSPCHLQAGQTATTPQGQARVDAEPYQPLKYVLSTAQAIQMFREQAQRHPNAINYTLLGQMYIRQARETGTFAGYEEAEAAIRRALELDRNHVAAQATLAQVLCAHHKFAEGLEWARQAYQKNPREVQILLLIGDAQLELGNYAEAEQAYAEAGRKDPLALVQSRQARLAELRGKPHEALRLMQQAAQEESAAAPSPESRSWYPMRLGEMHFNLGQLDEAARHYQAALKDSPHYPPALAGLGRVRAAQEKYDEAIELYRQAVVRGAEVALLAELGDLYTRTGKDFLARLNYDKLEQAAQNKPAYNRELSLFYSNHDRRLAEALELAKADLASRKDIYAYDTLAWALYKNQRFHEAGQAMEQALRLGTQDAQLFYHAGRIYHSLGQQEKARGFLERALKLNPQFSLLHAEDARRLLVTLGGGKEER
jgi:tetratricopeptide (TPR) repeat protein